MKVRQGFVSNSSSSSFTIIGKPIDWRDIDKYKSVWFIGGYGNEGIEAFILDSDFIDKYRNREFKDCEFWTAVKVIGESEERFTQEEIRRLTTDTRVYSFDMDDHNSYANGDIDEFEEQYLEEEV